MSAAAVFLFRVCRWPAWLGCCFSQCVVFLVSNLVVVFACLFSADVVGNLACEELLPHAGRWAVGWTCGSSGGPCRPQPDQAGQRQALKKSNCAKKATSTQPYYKHPTSRESAARPSRPVTGLEKIQLHKKHGSHTQKTKKKLYSQTLRTHVSGPWALAGPRGRRRFRAGFLLGAFGLQTSFGLPSDIRRITVGWPSDSHRITVGWPSDSRRITVG